jgi:hypothetical protein
MGVKRVAHCPVDTYLADEYKRKKSHLFLQSVMHACPRHGPGATCIRLSQAKAKSDFRRLKMGTSQLREKILTEKRLPLRIAGGRRRADKSTQKNDLS